VPFGLVECNAQSTVPRRSSAGLAGLKAGSQAGPGVYLTLPLYYRDSGIGLYNAQGDQIVKDFAADINLFFLPAAQVVTPFKILGANYGAGYGQWILNGVIDVAALNATRSTSYGFGDIYVTPVSLGWHLPSADITAGYSFFAPTGAGSSGKHMWVNELDLGGALNLGAGKKWNVSTMSYWDFHNKKNNANIKVGNILTLVGGIGRSFLKGAGNAGVAYGAQWKLTHDSGSDIPPQLSINNGRFFAVGPDFSMPVFAKGVNLGLAGVRYMWVVGIFDGRPASDDFTHARTPLPAEVVENRSRFPRSPEPGCGSNSAKKTDHREICQHLEQRQTL
jgi:Putative MetA-pathway of phenol degradation